MGHANHERGKLLDCPSCLSGVLKTFFGAGAAPAHSMLLMKTREEALAFPRGQIDLAFCRSCGFITNVSFDPSLENYTGSYEASQAHSPTFQIFHKDLAGRIIDQFSLRSKRVLEIGCGNGEFLELLCELGRNTGVGYDPAYTPGLTGRSAREIARFVAAEYSPDTAPAGFDLVCCKMTLEHVPAPNAFVAAARRALNGKPEGGAFFMVPDAERIFRNGAFWDVYYEHCSYFTESSLTALFTHAGFQSIHVARVYDGQYLCISAWLAPGRGSLETQGGPTLLSTSLLSDAEIFTKQMEEWRRRIGKAVIEGGRVVLWGGGSKAVAFTTQLSLGNDVPYVVDVNPRRQGTFLPGTGQEIVGPPRLRSLRPDLVVVMNSIYEDEIRQTLSDLDVQTELVSLDSGLRKPYSLQVPPRATGM